MTTVAAIVAVPDISKRLDPEFWEQSRNIYNGLPIAQKQLDVPVAQLQRLGNLLRQHGLQKHLGFHLVHRHNKLPRGMVSVGTYQQVQVSNKTEKVAICWIKPTPVATLPDRIHGNSYIMKKDGIFVPYDFVQGDNPFDLSRISKTFLSELRTLLEQEGLENTLALQVVHDHPDMREFELEEHGSLMIESSVTDEEMSVFDQITGWRLDGVRDRTQYERHAKTDQGHAIANKGAPLIIQEIVNKLGR